MTSADGSGLLTFHDEGLARRLKALACTAPLHDLDARKVCGRTPPTPSPPPSLASRANTKDAFAPTTNQASKRRETGQHMGRPGLAVACARVTRPRARKRPVMGKLRVRGPIDPISPRERLSVAAKLDL
jgi:hypothetical protein